MIILDGHNLIGRLPGMSLDDPNDEEKLVRLLSQHRGRMGGGVLVVFDPGSGPGGSVRSFGGIKVAYAPRGSTADSVILKHIERMKDPREALVVSSDGRLRSQARALGARVMSAEEFERRFLRSPRRLPPEKPEGPVDLEEWMEIFGGGNPQPREPGLGGRGDGRARRVGGRGTKRPERG